MLGHFGWILPLEDVDDAVAGKTDGKIYIHKRDIADGSQLAAGDIVGFYLYSDDQGLGAEGAHCLEKAAAISFNTNVLGFVPSGGKSPGMNVDVDEFVSDLGSDHEHCLKDSAATSFDGEAPEIVPSARPWIANKSQCMNPKANEYVPSSVSMNASAMDFVPFGRQAELSNIGRLQSVFAINLAYLSDDSSDDESDWEEGSFLSMGKAGSKRSLSPGVSTSAGLSSDDEADITFAAGIDELPEAPLGGQKFFPPPGLTLPSSPCRLAVEVLTRAGLSVEPEQQKKLPPWRRDAKASFANVVSKGFTPPWRQSHGSVAAA